MFCSFEQLTQTSPFPYFATENVLDLKCSNDILDWLETKAPWRIRVAHFYQQYEFSFSDAILPSQINSIFGSVAIQKIKTEIENSFKTKLAERVDITAHKLIENQRIRIHNDYIPNQESHRILIQLNRGWDENNGGILMIFKSENANDIESAFLPKHNSAFAFEISPKSFHAVSAVNYGERYTIVLSFYRSSDE